MKARFLPSILLLLSLVAALGLGDLARRRLAALRGAAPPTAGAAPPSAGAAEAPVDGAVRPQDPRIDVVFVLDTTGSMGGLIDGAKRKIWSIADRLVSGQPRPDVRLGLVAYRDRGDEYVTRATPLTRDIDGVQQALAGLRASGGGDGPEDVNAALAAALDAQPWEAGRSVLRLVFLVGDAPPHDDYDGPKSHELARRAKARGIVVNTLRAGQMTETEHAWIRIAEASGGTYASIEQDGGMVVETTPYDAALARLNRELAETVIGYGSAPTRAASARKMAARIDLEAPAAAAAAAFNAKAGHMNDEDLLTQIERGGVRLDALEESALPEELRDLDPADRTARILEKKARRAAAKEKILALSKAREAFLKEEKARTKRESQLDDRLLESLREQAARIDVAY